MYFSAIQGPLHDSVYFSKQKEIGTVKKFTRGVTLMSYHKALRPSIELMVI
jgi:hypothetical protein